MYFRKISAFEAWAPFILFLGCLLVLISSLLFGCTCLVLFLLKKMNRSALPVRLSPALAILGLLLVFWITPQLFEHMREATPMDTPYLVWTLGKYTFALFSVCTVFLLVLTWRSLRGRWVKGYLAASAFAGCYLLALLALNHWF
jgi:hypothetical protein